jgi:transcriptional regulator with XRE-family HTH domain
MFRKNISPIRIARVSSGLRQTDLAAEINRSQMFVSRLECGGYAVLTPEIADRIAEVLGVPGAVLFRGSK